MRVLDSGKIEISWAYSREISIGKGSAKAAWRTAGFSRILARVWRGRRDRTPPQRNHVLVCSPCARDVAH